MKIPLMKQLSWYLAAVMFVLAITPRVEAGFAPSEMVSISQNDRAADVQKIRNALEIKAVSKRLKQFGLSKEEIQQRIAQLNDQQIHQLATHLDDLKAGQGDALGITIAVLVIAILVVVLIKITGREIIITR